MLIRPAVAADHDRLCAIDSVAETSPERRDHIRGWLEAAQCHVVETQSGLAAYGVLTSHFFGHPFIKMVMVGRDFRRQGLGAAIIRHFQSITAGGKLFSSTNMSNTPMQKLFARQGFKPSGYVDNLDEGDPEIIFVAGQ
ncbi:N-acetyltransferase family protein [Labrys neptuniae]